MALTLVNTDYLTNDLIMAGIVEQTVEEDPLLQFLPFEMISGHKQVNWNRENSLGAESQFIGINEEVAESAPTWSNQTQTLSILADRIELDRFLVETKDAVQNVEAAAIASKAKQMMRKFHDNFYYGDNTASPNAFDGLHNLVSTATPDMTVAQGSGSTGAALSLANLGTLISRIKPGRPDVLIGNRTILRRLSAPYISNVQYNLDKSTFGDNIAVYSQIPIVVTDYLTQTETIATAAFSAKTGGATTSIFAVKFGRDARNLEGTSGVYNNNGILGIQANSIQVGEAHPLEKKIGFSRQLWWYVSVILGSTLSLARMDGITDAAATV